MQVGDYASAFEFSPSEYDEVTSRLKRLDKLMRTNGCRSTEVLLELVESTEEKLEQYYDMEGAWRMQCN